MTRLRGLFYLPFFLFVFCFEHILLLSSEQMLVLKKNYGTLLFGGSL